MSRFESPEANGVEHRVMLSANLTAAHDDTFTTDASRRPPDLTKPAIESDTVIGGSGSFGVLENFDLGLHTTAGPSPFVLVAKFQLMGDSSSAAKEGNTSIAITGSAGWGGKAKDGDQSGTFGPGGHNWSGKVDNTMTDVALIIGHRVKDSLLFYGGVFYSDYRVTATINQSISDDGLSPAGNYSVSTTGYQKGANIGLQFSSGEKSFYQVEGVYSDARLSDQNHSALRAGVSVGSRF